jgi:multisubunit Na+/H+ antiporter MnhB subunit
LQIIWLQLSGLLAVLACSVLVVRFRDLLSCAIALGAAGFFVGWTYFTLGATNLGVVQLLVEVIKTCILILVVSKTHRVGFSVERTRFRVSMALVLAVVFVLFALFVTPAISSYGGKASGLSDRYLSEADELTGASNVVTAILLGFRAYDTAGEVCVFFVATLGVVIVLIKTGGDS